MRKERLIIEKEEWETKEDAHRPTRKREDVISKAHPGIVLILLNRMCTHALLGLHTTPTCIMYIPTVSKETIAVDMRYFLTITNNDKQQNVPQRRLDTCRRSTSTSRDHSTAAVARPTACRHCSHVVGKTTKPWDYVA